MKILILAPYPLGEAPSQRFRFEHFLPSITERGWSWEFHGFLDNKGWEILYTQGNSMKKAWAIALGFLRRTRLMLQISQYDVVYIHREVAPLGPPVFEWYIAKVLKKRFIYDYDDAIWLPNTSAENMVAAWLKWHGKVASICRWAWKVTPGNAYLADFARNYNPNVQVFPTVVDTSLHRPLASKKDNQRPAIGWTGSHSTLMYLQDVVAFFQKLEQSHEFDFVVIADKNPKLPLRNFRFIPWNKNTEIDDLGTIDIGIMPLRDDQWAKGKCGFKAIQYLALGIPALVSPVGVNAEIVQHGESGFHCNTNTEWVESVKQLLASPQLCKEMGERGRQFIMSHYSVASWKERFLELFV